MIKENILTNKQNIKAPIRSDIVPGVYSWSVEYTENNILKKKFFLDVCAAYNFYNKIYKNKIQTR